VKIEVYVQHIFQEYPVTESITIESFGKEGMSGWKKYERNCGCRGNVAMVPIDIERINIKRVFLRSEEFGGLMYDPTSAVIYKLDHEAYKLIQLLLQDKDIDLVIKDPKRMTTFAKRYNVKREAISELLSRLKDFFLW